MKEYYIYILASKPRGVLYIGMTNNIRARLYQHINNVSESFSSKYHTYNLVYYKAGNDVDEVIKREKQLKKWKRDWKIRLIEEFNPEWKNLYHEVMYM